MRYVAGCLCLILVGLLCSASHAADRIKLLSGSQSTGKVVDMSSSELVLEVGATKKKIPVNEVDSVQFDGEPSALTRARTLVHDGKYEEAQTILNNLDAGKIDRPEAVKDVEFYRALVAARMALAGAGSKTDAGKKLLTFERANRNNYHYYEVCELIGDILAGLGKFAESENYYNKVGDAPWPAYRMRADVLVGRSLVGQKKYAEAITRFEEALGSSASDKEAERQKLAATLGKASALSGSGKTDEAIKLVEDTIAKTDAENQELHARAYTVLGNCYVAQGKKKEALLAFLHVDLLYPRFPEQHAEALANLARLWAELDKSDRATQAKALLQEKYPESAWVAK